MRIMLAALVAILAPASHAAQETPQLELAFTIVAELGEVVEIGYTGRGGRRIIPITGGTVEGEGITGIVRPGAWDWQLDRADGCTEVEADYFLEIDTGAVINVYNSAEMCPPAPGDAPTPVYTRPVFEAPLGEYQWMGSAVFVGMLELAQDHPVPAVRIRVYRVR